MRTMFPAILISIACGSKGEGGTGGRVGDPDADGDGVLAGEDCDETDPAIGAPSAWYVDADGDGYGDPATEATTCDPPAESVGDGTDCDDGDPDVHPGATELCDEAGVDEDCDGLANSEDDDASGAQTWYADGDGDGYGDPAASTWSCSPPEGKVLDASDCDDTRAAVHPGAEEICDGLDDDCESATSEDGLVTLDGAENMDTITLAAAAAVDGSTISVCAGTFAENVVAYDDVTIEAIAGAASTVIDAGGLGPAVLVAEGALTLRGFTLQNGTGAAGSDGTTYGGAIYAGVASALDVDGCRFVSNAADYGGAILGPADGPLTVAGSEFEENAATTSGGAIYAEAVEVASTTLRENTAEYGGALYVATGGVADLTDTLAEGNEAVRGGGAYLRSAALSGGSFAGNTAERGGGVYAREGSVVAAVEIEGNTATAYGGGLYVYGDADLDVVEIADNFAPSGGGVLIDEGSVTLDSVVVKANAAESSGGGLYAYQSDIEASATTVSENSAENGGGLFLDEVALAGDGTVAIDENAATGNGGGIYVYDESDISGASAEGNTGTSGGGLYVNANCETEDLVLKGNEASSAGGGAYALAWLSLGSAEIVENSALYGGGIYVTHLSHVSVASGVVTGNVASGYGGGARLISGKIDSTASDWGSGGTENEPDDVTVGTPTTVAYADFGAKATFTCDSTTSTCE